FDRIDLTIETPPVTPADMALPPPQEGTEQVAARVARARDIQIARGDALGISAKEALNARLSGEALEQFTTPDADGKALLTKAAEATGMSARGWTRTLRLARTIADLEGCPNIARRHIAEALMYRRTTHRAEQAFTAMTA